MKMICAFDTGWLCLVYAENSACRCCVDSYIFPYHLPNSELPRLSIMQCDKCRCIWGQTKVLVLLGMIGKCGKKIIKNKRGKLANQSRWGRGEWEHVWGLASALARAWCTPGQKVGQLDGQPGGSGFRDCFGSWAWRTLRERERERMYVSVCG